MVPRGPQEDRHPNFLDTRGNNLVANIARTQLFVNVGRYVGNITDRDGLWRGDGKCTTTLAGSLSRGGLDYLVIDQPSCCATPLLPPHLQKTTPIPSPQSFYWWHIFSRFHYTICHFGLWNAVLKVGCPFTITSPILIMQRTGFL